MTKTTHISRAALVALSSLVALCGWMGPAGAQEDGAKEMPPLEVSAGAWAVTDLRSGEYLAGSGASERLPMAWKTLCWPRAGACR